MLNDRSYIWPDIRFAQNQAKMSLSRLQEDLLNDFREQKQCILEQIELCDPLATSLRKPVAQRLASKGGLILAEAFCYLLSFAMVALAIGMNLLYPFGPLVNVRFISSIDQFREITEAEYLTIAVHALAGLGALLFYMIARLVRRIRLKNNVLHLAGKNMKVLVGQHLKRKAAIEAIEQRHFTDLPAFATAPDVNKVPNPGYDLREVHTSQ